MIYRGFDRENSFGVKLYIRVIFHGKSRVDFQTLHRHRINTATASNMKTHRSTETWVLNPNLPSKIPYDRIWNTFQIRLLTEVVYWLSQKSLGVWRAVE